MGYFFHFSSLYPTPYIELYMYVWSICKKNYCKLITGEKIMQKEITIVIICKIITTVWIYKKITVNHICKLITGTKICKLITSTNICEKITDLKNIIREH